MGTSGVDNLSAPAGQPMTLVGLAGNDVLTGNTGNDILAGGQGDDVISGGDGSDTAAYMDATAGIVANLATGTATGGDGTDTLASIENLVGSRYADTLIGDAQANTLLGGTGDDTLEGAAGGDRLSGGAGSDALSGGVGDDLLKGGEGSDTLYGGAGDDTLFGASENLPDLQSDTFEWKLGDAGTTLTPAHDVVRDMQLGVGGDALDLRDLLEGEVAGTDLAAAQSLDQYLHFTEVNGKAVLEVDPDAGTASMTQSITFDNMSLNQLTANLGLANGAPDVDIIREMLEQGNLKNSA